MSKVLKTAAIVVGAVALVTVTAGAAAGALAVGAGAASAGAAIGAIGTFSLVGGLTASTLGIIAGGLSLAAALTAGKPKLASTGTQTTFQADPDAPIPYGIGRTFIAGNIAHQASSGTSNELLHLALTWSFAGPIDSFEKFIVDNQTVTFGAGGAATGSYAGFMWLKTQLGAAPEAAALTPGSGSMPGWGAASKLSGYAAGLWTLKYDKKGKVFAAGVPKGGMVGKWVKVYDPRKDSTFPGGSGAHRPLIESTYEWSDNPGLHGLTWALGRRQNGQFVLGARQKYDSIDVAAFVEVANVADANGWKVGGRVTSADDPWTVLKAILQAGGAEPVRIGAMLSCIVNTPRVSLGTITAADLAGPCTVTATQGRRDRINGIIPKYRSEDHQWEMVDAAPVRVDSYVTFDGRRRTRSITYSLVQCFAGQQPVQAAQLAAYDIYNAREIPSIITPLKIRFVGVKPGDAWTLNIPEAGLANQLCILKTRTLDVGRGVPTLTWRSETTAKHAAALGKSTTPPPTPTLGLVDLSNIAAPGAGAWTATGTTLTANGVSVPAIVVAGAVDNPSAQAVLIEYRPVGSPTWIAASTEDANLGKFELTRVTSGTAYEIGISYIVRGVTGARRVLGPVTTGAWSGIEGAGAWTPVLNAARRNGPGSFAVSPAGISAPYWGTSPTWAATPAVGSEEKAVNARISGRNVNTAAGTYCILGLSDGANFYGLYRYNDGTLNRIIGYRELAGTAATAFIVASPLAASGQDMEVAHEGAEIVGYLNGVKVGVIGAVSESAAFGVFLASATSGLEFRNVTFSRGGKAGQSVLVGDLTNNSHQVGATSAGVVTSYSGASGLFKVFYGSTDVTSGCTFEDVSNPQGLSRSGAASIVDSSGYYLVTGGFDAGEETAAVTLRATHPTYGSVNKVFSLSKSKAGASGTSPPLISLALSAGRAHYDKDNNYVGGTITCTATRQNPAGGSTVFTVFNHAGVGVFGPGSAAAFVAANPTHWSGSGDTVVLSAVGVSDYIAAHGGTEGKILIKAHLDNNTDVNDTEDIVKVRDGEDGQPGEDGFTLSGGGSASVACSSNGTPKTGELPKTFTLKVMQGTTDRSNEGATTYAITSSSGGSASLSGTNGKVLSVTALSADSATFTVTISRSGTAIGTQEVKVSKSKDGSAANYNYDDTLNAPSSSTTDAVMGSFVIVVPNGAGLTMNANGQVNVASGAYPGRYRIGYDIGGTVTYSSYVTGEPPSSTPTEPSTFSVSDFTYANTSGLAQSVTVRLYGSRSSGSGAASSATGSVEGSVS